MISSGIVLLSSVVLSVLMDLHIATNGIPNFEKLSSTLSSENDTLSVEKASVNMSGVSEIEIGKEGEMNVEEEENWNVTELKQFAKEETMNTTEMNKNVIEKYRKTNNGTDPYSIIRNTQCPNRACPIDCNDTADCGEDPRVTCREKLCQCSRFHFRDPNSGECMPNITRILMWSRKSAKTESNAESQPSAFKIKQIEPYTILEPIWTKYKGNEEIGLGFIPAPVWAVIICICLLFVIYSLIIFDIF